MVAEEMAAMTVEVAIVTEATGNGGSGGGDGSRYGDIIDRCV